MTTVVKFGVRSASPQPRPSQPLAPSAPVFNVLFEGCPILTYAPGRTVFWEGDRAEHVIKVAEGVLRICRVLPNGRRAITGFAFAGDLLGLAYKDRYLFSAEAITPVKVARVTRQSLDAILSGLAPCGPQLICDYVRDELCAAQDQLMILVHQSADARLAGFLLHVACRLLGDLRAGTEFDLAMLRSDIADHLGLTMETVCRSMTRLRKSGCIGMSGPHRIRIGDLSRLLEVADWSPEIRAQAET
jgi:CRP/FNR family transcriptional regulator, anaerobic regulatory protein